MCIVCSRNASEYISERGNKRQGRPEGPIGHAPKGLKIGNATNNFWAAKGSGSAGNSGKLWG